MSLANTFLGGAPTSICYFFCPSACPSIHLSICCAPYLRNRTSSDHNFWYTYVKWWYLQGFFSFFQNFDFLGFFQQILYIKGDKWPKMKNNNYICHTPYLRNRTSSDHNFWYTYVKWWYLQVFFSFFKNLDFLGC